MKLLHPLGRSTEEFAESPLSKNLVSVMEQTYDVNQRPEKGVTFLHHIVQEDRVKQEFQSHLENLSGVKAPPSVPGNRGTPC